MSKRTGEIEKKIIEDLQEAERQVEHWQKELEKIKNAVMQCTETGVRVGDYFHCGSCGELVKTKYDYEVIDETGCFRACPQCKVELDYWEVCVNCGQAFNPKAGKYYEDVGWVCGNCPDD